MLPSSARNEDSPTTFGRFLLVERLAAGGMAEVYASRPLRTSRLPRVVAIKRMLPEIAARGDFIDMFVDEAKIVSRLDHENIVRSFEYGREAGSYYIAMEMLSGLDMSRLATLVSRRRRRIPPEIAAYVAEQVCAGLAHAHALVDEDGVPVGLIHRDVTPHNLIVGFDGTVKIVDFGIAKSAIQKSQTTVGMLKGKVCYMSPEQATRTARIDHRSDIYSTGVCLWEWLAGRRMFSPDEHLLRTLKKVRAADFKPIEALRPGLPEALTRIVAKALAKNPEDRYQSAEEMGRALEKYRSARCAMPKRALCRWLDRELADQRIKHEHRMSSISATPIPEGTIAYHPELEVVAAETRVAKRAMSSFVEAPTEVFFSVDVEIDGSVNELEAADAGAEDESAQIETDAGPTDIEVELPVWEKRSSGIQSRTDMAKARSAEPRSGETTTLVDESPWWKAYADLAGPDDWTGDDAETRKMGGVDDTPHLIDTLMPRERSVTLSPPPPAPRRRGHWAMLGAAAAAAAIVGVGLYFAQARTIAARTEAGVLQVRLGADVGAATVFVDGVERGTAPLTLGTITPGTHRIRVVAEGFAELVEEVEVASGATTIVAASLGALEGTETDDVRPSPEPRAATETATEAATDGAHDVALAPDLRPPAPELTARERARMAAEEARAEREARWERLQAYRARQARIAARTSTAAPAPADDAEGSAATAPPAATPAATPAPAPAPAPEAAANADYSPSVSASP